MSVGSERREEVLALTSLGWEGECWGLPSGWGVGGLPREPGGGGSGAPPAIQGAGVSSDRGWSTDPEAWRAGAGRAARPEGGREGETSVRESSGAGPSTELSAIMVTSYIHPVQYGNHSSCAAAEYLTCGQWTEKMIFNFISF